MAAKTCFGRQTVLRTAECSCLQSLACLILLPKCCCRWRQHSAGLQRIGRAGTQGEKGRAKNTPSLTVSNNTVGGTSRVRLQQTSREMRGVRENEQPVAYNVSSSKEPIAKTDTRQVFWLPDRPTRYPFPRDRLVIPRSGFGSVRPRLQRRDRNGFTPFSLFSLQNTKSQRTPRSPFMLPGSFGKST